MMERTLDWLRGYVRIAWWDGSAVDLRLHRLTAIIDALSGATEAEPGLMPARGGGRRGDRP